MARSPSGARSSGGRRPGQEARERRAARDAAAPGQGARRPRPRDAVAQGWQGRQAEPEVPEDDDPGKKPESGALHGTLQLQGKALGGLGLVMLWPKDGKVAKRSPKFRGIEQRNQMFAPHLIAVPVGSTVAFPNFDSIYHNVFSLSQPQRFDLGMYKGGDMREMKFAKPGIIRLGCNIHANMSAYLLVVDAPHYVVAE